jgi:RHH-type transcriptional regulator, proline utilization regulon repressor / proline dehydrogenase / delta 1-pyrroline-5-carboxylate dehydrogenase
MFGATDRQVERVHSPQLPPPQDGLPHRARHVQFSSELWCKSGESRAGSAIFPRMKHDTTPPADARAAIRAATYADETDLVGSLGSAARLSPEERAAIAADAADTVRLVRARTSPSMMEAFLAEYGLSTEEGVGLMCLAEALLRVPDAETIDELIADKIEPSNWGAHLGRSTSSLVNAATWGLMLTGRVLDDSPGARGAAARGDPAAGRAGGAHRGRAGDEADGPAVRARRDHRARRWTARRSWRGAAIPIPTTCWARRRAPITTRALCPGLCRTRSGRSRPMPGRRAVEPRHFGEAVGAASALRMDPQRAEVMRAGAARARPGQAGGAGGIGFNIDAEEADRLDLSLDVIEALLSDPALARAGTASAWWCRPMGAGPGR